MQRDTPLQQKLVLATTKKTDKKIFRDNKSGQNRDNYYYYFS